MSFRHRISFATAITVTVTVITASVLVFFAVRDSLRDEIDDSLAKRSQVIKDFIHMGGGRHPSGGPMMPGELPPHRFGGPEGITQTVTSKGSIEPGQPFGPRLPVSSKDREVAAGKDAAFFSDREVESTHLRVYTSKFRSGVAIQIARPLDEVDDQLKKLFIFLIVISATGIFFSLLLGFLVSRTALAPVSRLTDSVEHVSATHDLGERIEVKGEDEIARLASSFNSMLEQLDEADRNQRQLVADASHELRTPLSSLKTNIEVLAKPKQLSDGQRKKLLADVVEQLDQYTTLIGDLIDLARGDEPDDSFDELSLDRLVNRAVTSAKQRYPQISFKQDLRECTVTGSPARLDRAINNMLDNACKWSPKGGVVEATLKDGELKVRDHGPGFDQNDLPHVFDRFYRSKSARGSSGSGLGLAIVKQVAESHGGTVWAHNAEGGGAEVELSLIKDLS